MKQFVPDPAKGPVQSFKDAVAIARRHDCGVILSGPEWDKLPSALRAIRHDTTHIEFARTLVTAFIADIQPELIVQGLTVDLTDAELSEVFQAMERNRASEQVMVAALQVLGNRP